MGLIPNIKAESSAILSPCGKYRYQLSRSWDSRLPLLCWVMLNPSTADATLDDPTIRRCVGFARRDGFGGIVVVNLYALRATNPGELWKSSDPVGPDNDYYIRRAVSHKSVVVAWGANARLEREKVVIKLLRTASSVECLGVTKHNKPRHPLYVSGDSMRIEYGDYKHERKASKP